MKKYTFFCLCCLIHLLSVALVYGQGFTGPGSNNNNRSNNRQVQAVTVGEPVTVSEVRNLPNNSWVILAGNIVSALPGGKYYTFRDSSGEITLEIDWKVWRGLSAGVSERVEIRGEVEIERGQVIIDVRAITGTTGPNIGSAQAIAVSQSITVDEAKNLPNNSWVILTGNIVNALRDENYTFRDSSGEITLEIDWKIWRGLSVDVSDRIEISGEVKVKRGQVSIEVKAIRKK